MLCAHGAKHGWTRLVWICDVAAIVANHPDLDWAVVVDEARRLGIERMLRIGLPLARDLVGCGVPGAVWRLPDDRTTTRLAHEVRDRLLAERDAGHSALKRSLLHLHV